MSERTMVVGWDGSEGAAAAVRWAARTAARLGRELRIVRVVRTGPDPSVDYFAEAHALVAEVAPGLTVDTKVVNDHPIGALRDESRDASVVVVGTRGHSRLRSTIVGSVGEGLTQYAFGPVVVVRGETDHDDTDPVVVGVDGSPTSSEAIQYAARFALAMKAPLRAVAAAPDPLLSIAPETVVAAPDPLMSIPPESAVVEEASALVHRDAERFLQEVLSGLHSAHPELSVSSVVLDSHPVDALVEAARDAQLLVVGSHGRGGFAGMLLGSVSRSVLHHAPCPVAVVRPHG